MRRIALRVEADAVESVLDRLLPQLFDGVHVGPPRDGHVELVAYELSRPLPDARVLRELAGPSLVGLQAGEAPDDWRERRRRAGRGVGIGGRIWLRSPLDPAPERGLIDVVIERGVAFGTGAHPTTRMCVALLLDIEPEGAFADIGCGTGALAIVAAKLGFAPVDAVDRSAEFVAAARANMHGNGVDVLVRELDVTGAAAPPAPVVAANVPAEIHAAISATLAAATRIVIASGITPAQCRAVVAGYAQHGFFVAEERSESGWLALRLERRDG
jgi:ribosomal protein L11 methyltransferase